MPRYPRELYLHSNLKPTEKRTVSDSARYHGTYVDGNSPGPTQRPNYSIPLLAWLQERIDGGDIVISTSSESETEGCITGDGSVDNPININIPCLISEDDNNSLEEGTDSKLFVDLTYLQDQIDYLNTQISILQNNITNLQEQITECCEIGPLDVNFDDTVLPQICGTLISSPLANGGLHYNLTGITASGTDFNSFIGISQIIINTPDSTGLITKTYSYTPSIGFNNVISYGAGQRVAVFSGSGNIIAFVLEYLDNNSNHHFVKLTADLPSALGNGTTNCINNLDTTAELL